MLISKLVSENTVDRWVWRKPTNTGLFLNFAAICPIKWKSGLVFCMLHCARLICSSDLLFCKEVKILKSLFLANNYRSLMKYCASFLHFHHSSLMKYCANFLHFHPIVLQKMKTAMNARLAFLKFRI